MKIVEGDRIQRFNGQDQTIAVEIQMGRKDAAKFLSELWGSVSPLIMPQTDDQALSEWTDRGRCVRSSYSGGMVRIRTHAWHHSGDDKELHEDVLKFLRSKEIIE